MDLDFTFRDYKKFRSDSKLIVGAEQPDADSHAVNADGSRRLETVASDP